MIATRTYPLKLEYYPTTDLNAVANIDADSMMDDPSCFIESSDIKYKAIIEILTDKDEIITKVENGNLP